MNDLFFIVFEVLLIPVFMIAFGRKFRKAPPKTKNGFIAYKSDRALRNDETWAFAHRYFGRLLFQFGLIALAYSAIILIWALFQDERTLGMTAGILCLVNLVPMCATIYPTERALKRCFDQYGNRIDYDTHVDQ